MLIDLARQVLEEKYPQYEWYALSGYSDKRNESVIFITLNKRTSIARAYFSEQYMNVTVEKYDLTEKTNEKIRIVE